MYETPEHPGIRRHYLTLAGGRQVHYRRAGRGPPVVLLHQSPASSASLADLLGRWSADFTVLAPDTPGYGLSDPLPLAQPSMESYARALAEFLDALGVDECGLYGAHTGAMVAAEFAHLYPARCRAAILDGYVVLTPEERADLLAHYNAVPDPRPDGSHLPAHWYRCRDQLVFFPWYRRERAARLRVELPPARVLQSLLIDQLRAGGGAALGYDAAFRFDAHARAAQFTAPVWLLNYEQDAIAHHPGRLGALAPSVRLERHPDPAALEARARDILRAAVVGVPAPGRASEAAAAGSPGRAYADVAGGQMHGWLAPDGAGRPLLLVHDAADSSREWRSYAARLADGRPLLVADLPGHGETPLLRDRPTTVEETASRLVEACREFGFERFDVAGLGFGATIAAELARQHASLVQQLTLVDVMLADPAQRAEWAARLVPELAPRDDGAHLAQAWQMLRDGELWRPWYRAAPAAALAREPELDAARLHERLVELLKCAPALGGFVRGCLDYDLASTLAVLRTRVRYLARRGNGCENMTDAAARLTAGELPHVVAARLDDWPPDLVSH